MQQSGRHDIIVIGGGIVGASIAWHLTVSGAKVHLLSEKPGGIATPNSFAWINASWGNPRAYFDLRMRSIAEWKRLAKDVPTLPLSFAGGLCWDMSQADLTTYASQHSGWGYDIAEVDAVRIAAIEPALNDVPNTALYAAMEGVAEPQASAEILIADAQRRGMLLTEGIRVTALRRNGEGHVATVVTDSGEYTAREIVLAAGAGTATLAASVGIEVPVETPPGLLVHSTPVAPMLNGLVIAPELHVRQTADGRLVAGTDFGGMDPGTDPDGAAEELFGKLKRFAKGGDSLVMDFYTVGYRPMPKDGFPIIGRAEDQTGQTLPGLYIAVTHSGITLAPAIGLFAATEILEGAQEPLLAPYRLSRFS
ncbi:D-amino acid oxidase [Rhizobium sp. Leaf306]|uniref:NAD(P)/FAD-dependent oxidoreductase n=1 Tax=Rhizobium sp. Leaf306 TaxID=1736330 RepID=UPI000713AC6B|nr:FAD-binding oxidoreductase [Rhizobium sp. Leaf306]KQQ34722.1 D-amino acid oxidase [Rhizobium sp. Leaf306]